MSNCIAIGIITYRRPKMINKALKSLRQLIPLDNTEIQVVIVDNDENESAKEVVQERAKDLKFPVKYFVEKRRGIPFARNRAVEEAIKLDVTEIAFFDDDEVVEPDWIYNLYAAYKKFNCDIVTGPVLSIYPEKTPKWALKGKFYDRERFPTGTIRNRASSGNILFNIKWFRRHGFRFNEKMALSGGSDTHLTKNIFREGGTIRWVDNAIAYEEVPASRLTVKWLLQRHYRVRLTSIRNSLEQNGILHTYVFSTLNFFKNLVLFFFTIVLSTVLGSHYLIKALTYSAKACAVVAALIFRHDFEEYRTIHGE